MDFKYFEFRNVCYHINFEIIFGNMYFFIFYWHSYRFYLAFKKNKFIPIFESLVTLPLVLPPTVIGFYLLVFLIL